jgi:hypothetical protein
MTTAPPFRRARPRGNACASCCSAGQDLFRNRVPRNLLARSSSGSNGSFCWAGRPRGDGNQVYCRHERRRLRDRRIGPRADMRADSPARADQQTAAMSAQPDQQQPSERSRVLNCRRCGSHFMPLKPKQTLCTACIEWSSMMQRALAYRAAVRRE